jgi:hypothetical protein
MLRAAPPTLLAAALAAALGCTDNSRFSTTENESYCGAITLSGKFRAGLSPQVQMRLTLDANKLDGESSPGKIWTFENTRPEKRLLVAAPLRRIPAIENDALWHVEFGDGREQNRIFAVTPVDPEVDPLLAVLSLKTDDSIEVRLIRPGITAEEGEEPPPPGRRPVFGVFPLYRQVGTCGF